jgi:hypothetical protein
MYATIKLSERGATSTDDLAQAGHALAARLGAAPGFVAYLLLETPDDGCAAISIFEDRVSLAAVGDLLAGWSPAELPASCASPSLQITGEVIVQKGL